mmetsp:Transcript_16764/g.43525  ORF Transcript_16764/g.43525 Transcript_16764/m.43525 type:complete len:265 (-) Transcript_16764:187-981(-)
MLAIVAAAWLSGLVTAEVQLNVDGQEQMQPQVINDLSQLPEGAQRMNVNYGGEEKPPPGTMTPEMQAMMDEHPEMEKGDPIPVPKDKSKLPKVSKKDLPYVKCAVCRSVAKFYYKSTAEMQRELKDNGSPPMTEEALIGRAEEMCSIEAPGGEDWGQTHRLRPTKEGGVTVVSREDRGCKKDCVLLSKACEVSFGENDVAAGEAVYMEQSEDQLVATVCEDACSNPPRPLPSKHWLIKRANKERSERNKRAAKRKSKGSGSAEL